MARWNSHATRSERRPVTANLESLMPQYVLELQIDLERLRKYGFASYLVSSFRTTIAAHFVRLYQKHKLEFEKTLEFVDVLEGPMGQVRIALNLPADPVTDLIVESTKDIAVEKAVKEKNAVFLLL
jgi:hypothetical protein